MPPTTPPLPSPSEVRGRSTAVAATVVAALVVVGGLGVGTAASDHAPVLSARLHPFPVIGYPGYPQDLGVLPTGLPFVATADVRDGDSPRGVLGFRVYRNEPGAPADCSGPPVAESWVFVGGNGSYRSGTYVPTTDGVYRYQVIYISASSHPPVTTACDDPALQQRFRSPTRPTLSHQAAPPVVALGGSFGDTAELEGGFMAHGFLVFDLYGPDDPTCRTPAAPSRRVAVSGDGTYSSGEYTASRAGTWRFRVHYTGDPLNLDVTTACDDPRGVVEVARAPVEVGVVAPAEVALGDPVQAEIDVAGGSGGLVQPSGPLSVAVYGPDDPLCARAPVHTETIVVAGDGRYPTTPFTPAAPGTYRYVARFGGDNDHLPGGSPCGAPGSVVEVRGAADTTPPSCWVSALRMGPPKQQDVTVQDTGSGIAAIFAIRIVNGTVAVPAFTPGTTDPVVVTATKLDQSKRTFWEFRVVDMAGNVRHCI